MNWKKKIHILKERYLYSLVFFIVLFCIWQWSTKYLSIPQYILPSPSDIMATAIKLKSILFGHFLVTLIEVLLGFVIGSIVGFFLAIALFSFSILYKTLYPLMVAIQSIPKTALAPLFIIWFGFGMCPKILIATLIVLFPVLVNMLKGLGSVNPELLDFMKTLHASKWQILLTIQIPASIPYLFASLKVSVGFAVVGAIIGEFVGANKGLGYIIMLSSVDLDTSRMFAALLLLSIIGLSLFTVVSIAERIILPWHIKGDK